MTFNRNDFLKTFLLVFCAIAIFILSAPIVNADKEDFVEVLLASRTNLSEVIVHSPDKTTDLSDLIYNSIPTQELNKIESAQFKWSEVVKFSKTTIGTIILLFIIIFFVLFIIGIAIKKEILIITFFIGLLLVTLLNFSLISDKVKINYIEAKIASRAIVIETSKGSVNAKVKDVVILKIGKASVNTENGIVITDFKNIKLI